MADGGSSESVNEKLHRYHLQIAESGGFDVDPIELDSDDEPLGMFVTCDPDDDKVVNKAKFAIDWHNNKVKNDDDKLEFEEVIKSNWGHVGTYYTTLRAKNSKGESKVYQTQINGICLEEGIAFLREKKDPDYGNSPRCWTYEGSDDEFELELFS